ncbi:MAG: cell division protein FtsZ [Rikenellaceae bacterium]
MIGINEDITDQIAVPTQERSIITVVGIGGGGGNAVNYMWNMGIRNVSFLVCNTDQKALDLSPIENKIRLGKTGLGAGNDPMKGRSSAIESLEEVRDRLIALNTKMLFITAGMGGGTGTGAAPVIAKLAKEMDILTVAIVTSPLLVEGKLRCEQAMRGISDLKDCVDSLLIINNENIQNLYIDDPSAMEAFGKANEILSCAAKGVAEIITVESSYINVDFADVSKVMKDSGRAHMSVESAAGSDRAKIAVQQSLTSPLLDQNNITGAKNILLSMATSEEKKLGYSEMKTILTYVQDNAQIIDENGDMETANIIFGISTKPELGDNLEIVLVATGFDNDDEQIEDFDAYYRSRLAASQDPSSPFSRMNGGGGRRRPNHNEDSTMDMASPIACGESVILPEREPRYPNIETLLRTPAYIARKAKLITTAESDPAPAKRESITIDDENRLF